MTRVVAKWPSSRVSMSPLFERTVMIIRKSREAWNTWMPWRRTSSGRRCSTRLRRFCTSIWATSMSVPGAKVSSIEALPLERLVESM